MNASGRMRGLAALAVAGAVACKGSAGQGDRSRRPQPELALGQEQVAPGEAAAIAEIKAMLEAFVTERFDASGVAHRDAHEKAHGCVTARLAVHDGLPESLARGVFASPQTYEAWVRFSNSADHAQRDRKPDGRGMAIKLMNVPGEKVLPGHEDETSQDFVLINYPVFVVRDATDYIEFAHDSTIGHPLRFFLHEGRYRLPQLKSAEHLALQRVVSPLSPTYYSMTPYALGEGQAVKIGARPCEADARKRRKLGKNYLRKQLRADLARAGACFELMVQVQTDPVRMPVEDPTVEWPTSLSPYVPVATLTIDPQDFDTPEVDAMCEYLAFNPWHALPEHRPLGGINRVRKAVYVAIAALRHRLDGVRMAEPTTHDVAAYLAGVTSQ